MPEQLSESPVSSRSSRASTVDGRSFRFEAAEGVAVQAGALVTITDDAGTALLGQVRQTDSTGSRISGRGQVLGILGDSGLEPMGEARVIVGRMNAATGAVIHDFQAHNDATLEIGALRGQGIAATARLAAKRFNRHTFWCGQSGSGKTYALGVVLEQLLIHSQLPLVILDPNADFVRLGEIRPSANASDRHALEALDVRVLRGGADRDGTHPLRARFVAFDARAKAATLQLDPIADRDEYNSLLHAQEDSLLNEPELIIDRLRESGDPARVALATRIENLGILDWPIWAGEKPSVSEVIDDGPRAVVLDLSGLQTREELQVVALSTLDGLWERRESRIARLIVIDEAHNLCSPHPSTPLEKALTDRIVTIAAEGRKYGLWLLLSTQRPSKIHPNVLSQCDNLALMKLSSPGDLDELAAVFGYAPTEMMRESPFFRQGEALFAGGFVPAPSLVQMGERLTFEGGIDVPVPFA